MFVVGAFASQDKRTNDELIRTIANNRNNKAGRV
jgi:hypothetical protein